MFEPFSSPTYHEYSTRVLPIQLELGGKSGAEYMHPMAWSFGNSGSNLSLSLPPSAYVYTSMYCARPPGGSRNCYTYSQAAFLFHHRCILTAQADLRLFLSSQVPSYPKLFSGRRIVVLPRVSPAFRHLARGIPKVSIQQQICGEVSVP
jgi:hypothetical protein